MQYDIYQDIAKRTKGDIYIGVVGPVRTGKSTFVSQFMEKVVLPKISDKADLARATDELPQSAEGRTIMTTEPKFVPAQAVRLTIGEKMQVNAKLIDCVGYLIDGAMGHEENQHSRLVKTPWSKDAMPFEQAAEIGTKKVVQDHSNIAVVVTTDGTITDIARQNYVSSEEKVIKELKNLGKPFIVLLNSKRPQDEACQNLANQLRQKYNVNVLCVDLINITTKQIEEILEKVLEEFPIRKLAISVPKWMQTLPPSHPLICSIIDKLKACVASMRKMSDANSFTSQFISDSQLAQIDVDNMNMGDGTVNYAVKAEPKLFYDCLSKQAGRSIDDEFSLMSFVTECAYGKQQYDHIKDALDSVKATGYGIVMPQVEEMECAEPEISKSNGRYGVKLKAIAPSLHIMQVDVSTEVNPLVGTQQQSQYLLSQFDNNPKGIWDTNMFGKSLSSLAREGLQTKLMSMPVEAQEKIRKTVGRIINEGRGSLVCILL
ncbi:MAG: stage IV sporulation protein A [Clostridia bacterium]